jgi:hypothetical protein
VTEQRARPAFYAMRPGGWRDYLTLLHPPYTLWHLSYVAVGAALAPRMDWPLLGWTVLAFALAMGVGAHALDELRGRPLQTLIPARTLAALAVVSIGGASAIGVAIAVSRTLWLLVFVAVGAFLVVAYNLELFGGAFHGGLWFPAAWGAFPVLTAYFASARTLHGEAFAAAGYAFASSRCGSSDAVSWPSTAESSSMTGARCPSTPTRSRVRRSPRSRRSSQRPSSSP